MTAGPAARRGILLRWGLPRDPAATSHLAGFTVATVVTVLLTRAFLAAAGYPQIGTGGLYVAHVLWGGLLMAVGFVVLLSFAGPVTRLVGALLGGVDDDPTELPNPINLIGRAVVRSTRRLVAARWVPWLTVGVLVVTSVGTVGRGLVAWHDGADVPAWIIGGLLVGAAVSTLLAVAGLAVVRFRRRAAYVLFRRAVLVSLLVTQVFLFRVQEWAATTGLVVDLLVLGLVAAELNQMAEAGRPARGSRRWAGVPRRAAGEGGASGTGPEGDA